MSEPKVFLYVQHLQGVGHLYRAARIARAMTMAGLDIDIVTGGMPIPGLATGGARLHQLDPVHCPDGAFDNLRDRRGRPVDTAFKARRRDALLALFHENQPAAVIIEAFPFGRRQLDFELMPFLEAIKSSRPRPLLIASVRDILQSNRKPRRIAEAVELINTYFDAVLVHGDPAFATFEETFPRAAEIAAKIRYTGLVANPTVSVSAATMSDEVVVSAGGGATDSEKLLRAAMSARPLTRLAASRWRLLAGPNLPYGEFEALKAMAPSGVTIEPNRGDFAALLAGCAVSVSQAGYNTVAELLRAGCRAVVVPYAARGETEQSFRATRLAERKLAHCVKADGLTSEALATVINAAHAGPPPARGTISLVGAEKTAAFVGNLLKG